MRMRQCIGLIRTNENFRKSVNLQLDLGNYERIGSYIPTRSSAAILDRYLSAVSGKGKGRATILIGPYGKGKSHLLLVLLSLLSGASGENEALLRRLENAGERCVARRTRAVWDAGKKYLAVLVNPVSGAGLNQAFVIALREALLREGLADIAPDSYYSEALTAVKLWERAYPETYQKFGMLLKEQGTTPEAFETALAKKKREALAFFRKIYPALTAGNVFAPMLTMDAMGIYRKIGRMLTEEYGYAGIYIVFDEFSKYIEGHPEEGFSNDMRTLQDICELAESGEPVLFLTLAAHKSVRAYKKGIPEAAKNAFRGVEGRLTEVEFVVSAQNDYELIADALIRREPQFSRAYRDLLRQTGYREFLCRSREMPCFSRLFSEKDFFETIGKKCFPMTPLSCYALLRISERVAQNERTVFTFLAGEGQGSLGWILQREADALVGVDRLYDYFTPLFRDAADQPSIHREWAKAENALERLSDETERAVVKALAVIRMIRREEELPAREGTVCLSLSMDEESVRQAMRSLVEKEIIVYRSSVGAYAFRSRVGVNIEKEILKKASEYENRGRVCDILDAAPGIKYEIPRKYNLKYAMTRYFQYVFLEKQEFLGLSSAEYLFEESFSDGKIVVVIWREGDENDLLESLRSHLDRLGDARILLLLPDRPFAADLLARKYHAVRELAADERFVDGNRLLAQELSLYEEDIASELGARMQETYLPWNGHVQVLRAGRPPARVKSAAAFGSLLSAVCEDYYGFSPKVNHELLNIRKVGPQYLRARNKVVKKILEHGDLDSYGQGTSPEAMIYRAAFFYTREDAGYREVCGEIGRFLGECAGKRVSFEKLYTRLSGRDYGVRKGVIPLFLAKNLADLEAAAVVYSGGREIGADYEILNKVNEAPGNYELYLEQETAEKEAYLAGLEHLFCRNKIHADTGQERIAGITRCVQRWYRSLPQCAMVTMDFPEAERAGIHALRRVIKRAEINPRELLFDRFPEMFLTEEKCADRGVYEEVLKRLEHAKELLDGRIDVLRRRAAKDAKAVFGVCGDGSLKARLEEWEQSLTVRKYVLGTAEERLLKYIGSLKTYDETEIAARLSKIVLDVYIEDWRDDTPEAFLEELSAVRARIQEAGARTAEAAGCRSVLLRDADGREIEKYFDADTTDTTSRYLKNVMAEAMEDFGEALAPGQKAAVLAELLEEILT